MALKLMPKSKAKLRVFRWVRVSQLGPQGQSQTAILNQTALTHQCEAAMKAHSDLLQGTLFSMLLETEGETESRLPPCYTQGSAMRANVYLRSSVMHLTLNRSTSLIVNK